MGITYPDLDNFKSIKWVILLEVLKAAYLYTFVTRQQEKRKTKYYQEWIKFSTVAQRDQWHPWRAGMQVQSPVQYSGLMMRCCHFCGVGQKLHMLRAAKKGRRKKKKKNKECTEIEERPKDNKENKTKQNKKIQKTTNESNNEMQPDWGDKDIIGHACSYC